MSIDTTFKPLGPTVAVDNTAPVQVVPAGNVASGVVSFRIRNINAAAIYVAWAPKSAGLAATAPVVGTPSAAVGIPIGGVFYVEAPYNSFFVASIVAPALEITPGMGGVGG